MFVADGIKEMNTTTEINGKWVLARPLPFYGVHGLMYRIKDAYKVLCGSADAVQWIEQQVGRKSGRK